MSLKSGQLMLVEPDCNAKPLKTNGKVFRIGSYLSCDLVLDEPDAKRIHCEIQSDAFGRISITNHSKRNPVLINGVPVKGTRPLYSGSLITIFDKKLKWLNKQRVGRDDAPITDNENDVAVTTPKMIRHQAEHAPNSEPSLLVRKKAKSKRITMHTLAHNMDMESDDDFHAVNDENDDEFQENLTKISMKSAMKNSGATPPRSTKRMSKVNNRRTINSPTSLRFKTLNKESAMLTEVPVSPKVMLLKCKSSGMVVTSYSPTTTPNKTPKSYARVLSNKNTPTSTYGTPRSVLSELNAFDEVGSSPKTPLSLTSMHLIDFTTPDIFKTPLQKKITPLFKSALKNSAAKSSLKSGSISKPNFTLVPEESSPSPRKLNTPKSSANKIRWESPNSLKKIEVQSTTPKKTASVTKLGNIKSLETSKCDTSKQIFNSSDKRSARKSVSRLTFAATETPPELITRRRIITSNTNTPLRSSGKNSPVIRKSMNRSISTPLKTPKAIFLQNDTDKKESKSIMENRTPKRHSSYTLKAQAKNSTPNKLSSDETNVVLTRSSTFILDEPTVSKPTQNNDNFDEEDNTEKPGNGTFTCEEDVELNDALNKYSGAVSENTNKEHESLVPILEEEVSPSTSQKNSAEENNKNELSNGEGEKRNFTDLSRTPKNVKKHEKKIVQAIKNDLSDVEGVKHLFNAQPIQKTPILRGIKELVQTPKCKPEENLIGIKELLNTPKANSGLDNVRGMKELFNTPNRDDLSDLLGVKELLSTPKENVGLSNPLGMKELFNTPMRDDLTDVYGVKELVNTPKPMAGLENPKGLKELFNTPMRDDLTNVTGVKEFMKTPSFRTPRFKTPKVPSYEDNEGLKNIFKTPASGSVMILGTPKSIEVKKNSNMVENQLKTPCVLDLGEDMEDVDEIYNTPVSKFIDYPEEEEINDQTNEKDKNLSPEETFDKLVGKPTVKRTYGRTTMTPNTRSMNTTLKSLESCIKTDIQEWIDNVHNSHEYDEKLCEDFIPLSTKSTRKSIASFDNSSPSFETNREPLAASSSIKPRLRRSLRNTEIRNEFNEVTEMSGIEQLDNTINSESEFSGVLIYSEASNDEASTIDVDAEESKTPKKLESRVSKINTHTPQKYVQFVDDSVIGTLKMTPQIRRIRGRIATPHSAKYSLHAVQKSPRGPFNDLSIQFIDESSVIESETGRNTSCYRISQSRNGTDISVKLVDKDRNSTDNGTVLSETIVDSPIPEVNEEYVHNISTGESFSTSMNDSKSKRKSRKVVNENGCVIFISDDEESVEDLLNRSNLNETDPIRSSDTPLADRNKSIAVHVANLTPKSDLFENSRRTSRRIIDKSMGIESNLSSNISMKSRNLSVDNGSVKVISFNNTKSYEAEEDKLLDLYEFEVSKGNIANKSTELVYISSEEQHEDTQNIKTINELISTVKEHPMLRETRGKSESAEKPMKVSKLKRQTIGHKPKDQSFVFAELNPIKTRLSTRKREFSQLGDISREEPEDLEQDNEPILSEEINDSVTTLWKSVAMNITGNIDSQLEDNNLATTEEEMSDISFESCSEIESSENEFENFSENPTTKLSRVKSLTPDVKKSQKKRLSMRKTLGSVSRNSGTFDYKAELDRRNMSQEFKNFELNGPKDKASRGRSQNFHKTPKVSVKNRLTVGESPLSKCFNYEGELERRNMSLEFENFETEAPKDKVLRARSQSPEKKLKMSDKNRRTIGKAPLSKSFDYKAELDRRNMSLEFQNFELEGKISTSSRGRSLNTQETKMQIDIKRRTVGQTILEESFDYEAEIKRRNMSLEFQNFDAENARGNAPRGRSDKDKVSRARSQSPEKKLKMSDKNRRTIGKAPLSKSFDYKAELDRRNMSLEFQNFELEGKISTSSRGRSLSTQETKRQIEIKRRTAGQTTLEESFDYEAKIKRRNMSLEFQNFDAENLRGNALRGRSESPQKKPKSIGRNRRTVGENVLENSFDYDYELDRRNMSLDFANFKNSPQRKTRRGYSITSPDKTKKPDNSRRTVGHKPSNDSFDYEVEKNRRDLSMAFEKFEEKPQLKMKRGDSISSVVHMANRPRNEARKTMGFQTEVTLDIEYEKNKFLEDQKLVEPNIEEESTSSDTLGNEIQTNKKRILFSNQINEEIVNVTEVKNYEVIISDDTEVVFKEPILSGKNSTKVRTRLRTNRIPTNDSETNAVIEEKTTRGKKLRPEVVKDTKEMLIAKEAMDASRHVHFGDTVYYEIVAQKTNAKDKTKSENGTKRSNKSKKTSEEAAPTRSTSRSRKAKATQEKSSDTEISTSIIDEVEKTENVVEDIEMNNAESAKSSNENEVPKKTRAGRRRKASDDNIKLPNTMISIKEENCKPKDQRSEQDVNETDKSDIQLEQSVTKTRNRRGKKVEVRTDQEIDSAVHSVQPVPKSAGRRDKKKDETVAAVVVNLEIPEDMEVNNRIVENNSIIEIETIEKIEQKTVSKSRARRDKSIEDPPLKTDNDMAAPKPRGRRGRKAEVTDKISEDNKETDSDEKISTEQLTDDKKAISRSRTRQPKATNKILVQTSENISLQVKTRGRRGKKEDLIGSSKDCDHFEIEQEIKDPVKQSVELSIEKPASKSNSRRAKKAPERELNSTPVISNRDESSNSELIEAEDNAIPTGSNLPAIPKIPVENVPTRATTRRGRQIVNSTAEDSSTFENQSKLTVNQENISTIEFKTPNSVQPGLRVTRLRSASINTPIKNQIELQENLIVKPRGRRMALGSAETSTPKTPKDENNMQPAVEFKTPVDVKPRARARRLRSTTDDITPVQSESIVEKVATKTRGRRAAVTTADSSTLLIEEQSSQKEANDENRNPVDNEPQPKTKRARKAKQVTSETESSTQDIEKASTSSTSRTRSKRKIDESNDAIENVEAPKRVTRGRRK